MDAGEAARTAMVQPNVFWTLNSPFATIVGLYTNVPEGGVVEADQAEWFAGELAAAPKDRALIVALHHPVYSLDVYHSGSRTMAALLEAAVAKAGGGRTRCSRRTCTTTSGSRWPIRRGAG